jgi:hypothetical protein
MRIQTHSCKDPRLAPCGSFLLLRSKIWERRRIRFKILLILTILFILSKLLRAFVPLCET